MKKSIIKWTTAALTVLALSGSISLGPVHANTIATVGDKGISQEEFYNAMKNLAGNVTLRTMILEEVLIQNATDPQAAQKAANEEVDAQIEETGGEETFQQLLDYQQLGTIEEFRHQVYIRNLFQDVIRQHIDMSDEAIQAFYDNGYQTTMEAQHILVETEEEANAVIERLENGEEFDAVAQEVSLDTTAQNGGLLSPFVSGQMVPEFEEAVKSQENGEITDTPVESQYGYHIIKTLDNGAKKPLAEVRAEVEDQYVTQYFADSQFAYGVIGQLIIDMGVDIHDPDLSAAVDDLVALAVEAQPAEAEAENLETGSEEAEENNE